MIYNKQTLFMDFAPSFNFELDADQLLALALEREFVKEIGPDQYQMDEEYAGKEIEPDQMDEEYERESEAIRQTGADVIKELRRTGMDGWEERQ